MPISQSDSTLVSKPLSKSFADIREALEFHANIAEEKGTNEYYRLDRRFTDDYFKLMEKWETKLREYFKDLHKQKKTVYHVDICGSATAQCMGADKSYCFSLNANELRGWNTNNIYLSGDIFNTSDFSKLLLRLKKDNAQPALVTFEPVAGLQEYWLHKAHKDEYDDVSYGVLEKRLKDMIQILRPGGYVYLSTPFEFIHLGDFIQRKPQNQYKMSLRLKKIARQQKCRIEIADVFSGPYFLMNKPIRG